MTQQLIADFVVSIMERAKEVSEVQKTAQQFNMAEGTRIAALRLGVLDDMAFVLQATLAKQQRRPADPPTLKIAIGGDPKAEMLTITLPVIAWQALIDRDINFHLNGMDSEALKEGIRQAYPAINKALMDIGR